MNFSKLSLTDFIKSFSSSIWSKIGFIHATRGLRIHEVAITQDLVYYFYVLSLSRKSPVKIFESNSERTNGNDLEILIELNEGVIKILCQAKIIHRSGAYGKLNYRSNGQLQIDLLLKYAQKVGGYPAYLFYNHFWQDDITHLEKILVPSEELWGCTIGSAHLIKSKFIGSKKYKAPKFLDIHDNPCKPLYLLAQAISTADYGKKLKELFSDFDLKQLKKHTLRGIENDHNWIDLTPRHDLGYVSETKFPGYIQKIDFQQDFQPLETFNPKFRILISKENLNATTITYLY